MQNDLVNVTYTRWEHFFIKNFGKILRKMWERMIVIRENLNLLNKTIFFFVFLFMTSLMDLKERKYRINVNSFLENN